MKSRTFFTLFIASLLEILMVFASEMVHLWKKKSKMLCYHWNFSLDLICLRRFEFFKIPHILCGMLILYNDFQCVSIPPKWAIFFFLNTKTLSFSDLKLMTINLNSLYFESQHCWEFCWQGLFWIFVNSTVN